MFEFEKKILLSKEEYEKLRQHPLLCTQPIIQTNYYYDTDDLKFNAIGTTFRIRAKDGKFTAEIKHHTCGEQSDEIVCDICDRYNDQLFKNMGAQLKGELKTDRISNEVFGSVKLMLDANRYLEINDYELEVEYIPESEQMAISLINEFSHFLGLESQNSLLKRVGSGLNKSNRFFNRLKSLSREGEKI